MSTKQMLCQHSKRLNLGNKKIIISTFTHIEIIHGSSPYSQVFLLSSQSGPFGGRQRHPTTSAPPYYPVSLHSPSKLQSSINQSTATSHPKLIKTTHPFSYIFLSLNTIRSQYYLHTLTLLHRTHFHIYTPNLVK